MSLETDRLVAGGQRHDRSFRFGLHREGGNPRVGSRVTHPPPARHRHVLGRAGARLGVLDRDARAPLDVGDERRAELGVVGQPGLVGGLEQQLHPARTLLLGQALAHVLGDHRGVAAVAPVYRFGPPNISPSHAATRSGWSGDMCANSGASSGSCGHVLLVEEARHPGQRGQAAGPLEQRRLVVRRRRRVLEVDVPVHAAAERLVLRLPAAAQAVVLARGALRCAAPVRRPASASGDPAGHRGTGRPWRPRSPARASRGRPASRASRPSIA